MLIVSSEIVSAGAPGLLRFFVVIFTARRAVFICGDTDVIVPFIIVSFLSSIVTVSLAHFMRNLYKPCQPSIAAVEHKMTVPTVQKPIFASRTLCLPNELHFGGCAPASKAAGYSGGRSTVGREETFGVAGNGSPLIVGMAEAEVYKEFRDLTVAIA